MDNKGMLVIISGPSGSGKGTVVKKLKDSNINYALSISMTTRKKRVGEIEDKDYFFVSENEFNDKRDKNELLEHAVFCGNCYGTPRSYVESQIAKGKAVVLEIDVNGAIQVSEKFSDAVLIFLMPPTRADLKDRLIKRNTESKETIEDRLKRSEDEIKLIEKYDYLVINDEVDDAVEKINTIVKAEYLKPHRCKCYVDYFKGDVI